jgi:hypothetical protein
MAASKCTRAAPATPTGLIPVRREESRRNRNRVDALVHLKGEL